MTWPTVDINQINQYQGAITEIERTMLLVGAAGATAGDKNPLATIAGGVVTDRREPFPLQRIEQELNDLDVYDKTEADERFLQIENNLSDLDDAKKARESLDVHSKDEADERFLQAENNLSDLDDKEKARKNLGLGGLDGEGFRAIIDAVFWVGRSVISDSDPGTRYTWQTWRDLSADYDGRVLRISNKGQETGGSNSVKIKGDTGLIDYGNEAHLAEIFALAEAKDVGGKSVKYRVNHNLARAVKFREAVFSGEVSAPKESDLMAYRVTFTLKEYVSTAEKRAQAQAGGATQAQVQTAQGTSAATDTPAELGWFEKVLQRVDRAIGPYDSEGDK